MGDILHWAVRYATAGLITYLWLAYVDLVRGPRVEFGRNACIAAAWWAFWAVLIFTALTRPRLKDRD